MRVFQQENPIPLPMYIKEKIRMLEKDFCIHLSADEKEHFRSLTDEVSVDRFARDMFARLQ